MGTESYPLNITPNKNYEIEVILKSHPERKEIIQGIIFEYEIIRIKRKILELKLGESLLSFKKN